MEKIIEISKKYILDDDFDRLVNCLEQMRILFLGNDSSLKIEKHKIDITKNNDKNYIEFDGVEKIEVREECLLSYLEYLLSIYKNYAVSPNCIINPVVKLEPKYSYMEISVDDIAVVIKNDLVENLFNTLKESGLLNGYSVYSSIDKYKSIKKSNGFLNIDELMFNFYNNKELNNIKKLSKKKQSK